MKYLLVGINAKYIHSNPGIYSLKAYADSKLKLMRENENEDSVQNKYAAGRKTLEINLMEFTINQQIAEIRKMIYLAKPDWIGISCYIWNIEMVKRLVPELAKLMPAVPVWLGGPEVSFHVKEILETMPEVTGIIIGEGEETFYQLVKYYGLAQNQKYTAKELTEIRGIAFRFKDEKGLSQDAQVIGKKTQVCITPSADPLDMDTLPFLYEDMQAFENRIVYYETSRGCPFQCAYCLSGIDRKLRFRNMDLVLKELSYFLEKKVKQVKFIDRTFNIEHKHAMEILHYIKDHDNGITNFHFEIAADILTEEEIELLKTLRPGLVQLEIGVQSTNLETLSLVHRKTDLDKLRKNTAALKENHNIHLHLDLIAGLPGENLESFIRSFNEVYSMGGDELQLGFLKLLKGSPMEALQEKYELVTEDLPPYEVLSTRDLSYEDILLLKDVEEMLELYHNSQQFSFAESYFFPQYSKTAKGFIYGKDNAFDISKDFFDFPSAVSFAANECLKPFDFYSQIAEFYHKRKEPVMNSSRIRRYEILLEYFLMKEGIEELPLAETGERELSEKMLETAKFRELLTLDYYYRENAKARPKFAFSMAPYKNAVYDFYREERTREYLRDYEGYDFKQLQRMTHLEILQYIDNGKINAVLFDYHHRNPVTGGCRMIPVFIKI